MLIKETVKQVVYDNLYEWNIQSNDIDLDGICNNLDNCPDLYNPQQEDFNNDNIGDACDGLYINEKLSNRKLIRVIDIRQVNNKRFILKFLMMEVLKKIHKTLTNR